MDEINEKIKVLYYMENLLLEQKAGFTGPDKELRTIENAIEFVEGWIQYHQTERKCKASESIKKS